MGANVDTKAEYMGESHTWRCPACEGVTEEPSDPRGSVVECGYCPWEGRVSSE